MEESRSIERDIAIIGYSPRLPGVVEKDEFWGAMLGGEDFISQTSSDRWNWRDVQGDALPDFMRGYLRWGGFLPDIRGFDRQFFKIPQEEARLLDPQQRFLLEGSWQALEAAGYAPGSFRGSDTGIFLGICSTDYRRLIDRYARGFEINSLTGTLSCIAANRISYFFDFHGPSMAVDTACSSSLGALHQAVAASKNGECRIALTGGVNVLCSPVNFLGLGHGQLRSTTGKCRSFSDNADGYVRGEGSGWVVLKRFDRAIEDGDFIHARIKGSAVNHGGQARTITAPNPYAQSQVILRALDDAGISCNTISYIEAHGTGTPLGDPMEVQGLVQAFSQYARKHDFRLMPQHCGVGTIKTNIGHLEAASGIASIIKVIMAMRRKQLPPLANFRARNPRIKTEETPFYLLDEPREWAMLVGEDGRFFPRRAGVSSFGFGGTNAHILLEEFSMQSRQLEERQGLLAVPLSANSESSLRRYAGRLQACLENNDDLALADIAHTLQTGRDAMRYRTGFVAGNKADLLRNLREVAAGNFNPDSLDDSEGIDPAARQIVQWIRGENVSWQQVSGNPAGRRIPLPAYVFDHSPYFIETSPDTAGSGLADGPKDESSSPEGHHGVHRNACCNPQ